MSKRKWMVAICASAVFLAALVAVIVASERDMQAEAARRARLIELQNGR